MRQEVQFPNWGPGTPEGPGGFSATGGIILEVISLFLSFTSPWNMKSRLPTQAASSAWTKSWLLLFILSQWTEGSQDSLETSWLITGPHANSCLLKMKPFLFCTRINDSSGHWKWNFWKTAGPVKSSSWWGNSRGRLRVILLEERSEDVTELWLTKTPNRNSLAFCWLYIQV